MTEPERGTLARTSLPEAIRIRLREQILSGELAMGERLTEQGIAADMGTSAGPVREAFARLSYEGLLVSLPNRGTFVAQVTEDDARGAYAIRARLESYAFEQAAPRLTPDQIAELERIVVALQEAAGRDDDGTMITLDMRFHGTFYTASGNPILAGLWPLLEGTICKFVAVAGPQYNRDRKDLIRRHRNLLDNVKAGNMAAVSEELAGHGRLLWDDLPLEPPDPAAGPDRLGRAGRAGRGGRAGRAGRAGPGGRHR